MTDWQEAYYDLVNKVECECVQQGDLVPIWEQFKRMSLTVQKLQGYQGASEARIEELEAQLAAERGAQSVNLSPPSHRRSPMTDELIEELARAIGQKIEGPAEDMDSTWYGKPLWKSYVEEAQAILPIIDRLTLAAKIEGAELMREAARKAAWFANHPNTYIGMVERANTEKAIRALDAAEIVGGSHD